MNAQEILNVQTLENQAFALASRLHVMLRRGPGRVTDIEYMAQDAAYCRHVLDFAGKAEALDAHDLCAKLEEIFFGPHGIFIRRSPPPPVQVKAQAEPEAPAQSQPDRPASARSAQSDRYIGRLR